MKHDQTDLRSDTMTKPTPKMLHAMMEARVGDDVFGEDEATNELQSYAANLFGMEAALFCPSGTMTNQIAIKVHTRPGDEVICDEQSHVYIYEGGGIAFNSGAQVRAVRGRYGKITAAQIEEHINPDDVHRARTSLVSLENTSNRGGGSCYDLEEIQKIHTLCQRRGLKLHLDGARLFNALIARKQTAVEFGHLFDSISICLSKGLGAPVGSLLLGGRDFIQEARRVRKVLGGGMRQCGYLAAAGMYALKNNVERLAVDHERAAMVAEILRTKDFVEEVLPVETNILIFELAGKSAAKSFCEVLRGKGILALPVSETKVRMVFHLDISEQMMSELMEALKSL